MTMKTFPVGRGKKKHDRYFIEPDTGSGTIAYFDSLEIAALVLRYLNCANVTAQEADEARAAMRAYDARNEKEVDGT